MSSPWPRDQRAAQLYKVLIELLAHQVNIEPSDLEQETRTVARRRVDDKLVDEKTLALYKKRVDAVDDCPPLGQRDIARAPTSRDAENAALKMIGGHLKRALQTFRDPPQGDAAQLVLAEAARKIYLRETSRLDGEDKHWAAVVVETRFSRKLDPRTCLDRARATAAAKHDLAAVNLPSMPTTARRQPEAFQRTVATYLREKLGLRDLKGWESKFPGTQAAIARIAGHHVADETGRLERLASQLVNELTTQDLAPYISREQLDRMVVAVANRRPSDSNAAATAAVQEGVRTLVGGNKELHDILLKEDQELLARRLVALVMAEAERKLQDFRSWLPTFRESGSQTLRSVRATDQPRRDELIDQTTKDILASYAGDACAVTVSLGECRTAALARAQELVDQELAQSHSALLSHVKNALAELVGSLKPGPAVTQTADTVLASVFPLSQRAGDGLAGTKRADLSRSQLAEMERIAEELLDSRRRQLAQAAIRRIRGLHDNRFEAITALDYEKSRDAEVLRGVEARTLAQLKEELGDEWTLPGVEAAAKEWVAAACKYQVVKLRNEQILPALRQAKLPPDRFNTARELNRLEAIVPQATAALVDGVKTRLGLANSDPLPAECLREAAERAAELLNDRRTALVTQQLEQARKVAAEVQTGIKTSDTVDTFLERDVDAVLARAKLDVVLEEVRAQIRNDREPMARRTVEHMQKVAAATEEQIRRLSGDPKTLRSENPPTEEQIAAALGTAATEFERPGRGKPITLQDMTLEETLRFRSVLDGVERGREEERRTAEAAGKVEVPRKWFSGITKSGLEEVDVRYSNRVKELTDSILIQARFDPQNASQHAKNIAENHARVLLRKEAETALAGEEQRKSDRRRAEEIWPQVATVLVSHWDKVAKENLGAFLTWSRERITHDIEAYLAKHFTARELSPGVKEQLVELIVGHATTRQWDARKALQAEVAKWQVELITENKEAFERIKGLIADWRAKNPNEPESDLYKDVTLQRTIADALKERHKANGGDETSLEFVGFEIRQRAEAFAPLLVATYDSERGQGPPAANTVAKTSGQSDSPEFVSPPTAVNVSSPPSRSSSRTAPGAPTLPPRVGGSPRVALSPPTGGTAPKQPLELVITVWQPDRKSSRAVIEIQEYLRNALPGQRYGPNCVRQRAFVLGEASEVNFTKRAGEIYDWLNNAGGIPAGVDWVRNRHKQVRNPTILIHLRTAGDAIPQGLGSKLIPAIATCSKRLA